MLLTIVLGTRERRSSIIDRADHDCDENFEFRDRQENDELETLLSRHDEPKKLRSQSSTNIHDPVGFAFSVRKLAIVPFIFLLACHIILARQCMEALIKKHEVPEPIVRRWRVATTFTALNILSRPKTGSTMRVVNPGDIVETYGHDQESDYHLLIEPAPGFIAKRGKTGNERLEPMGYHYDSAICPMLHLGTFKEGESKQRYSYAPTPLVVAQQLWNAMQVLQLFLLFACLYEFSQDHPQIPLKYYNGRKWATRIIFFLSVCILPFSVYLISPGARIFSLLSLPIQFLAILTPVCTLRVSIGENDSDAIGSTNSKPWTISREETLACVCNLGSSLYNYAGSIRTWPHWKRHFYKIDAYFGWPDSGDCFVNENFTIGISNMRVPLYVARATGTRTGAQVFLIVWSILPFLYVSYFLCMYALAPLSPGKKIQRAFCLYGICHFLFFTDVVAYRYGRGMHSPHGEFFHWLEKFAWRVAMLMPIYQNCTNGHWLRGHRRLPILGKVLRWILMVWFVFFFLFQVIQSDVVKFVQFLLDSEEQGLIDMAGLTRAPFFRSVLYPYREALVTMIIMYGLLHCCGFTTFRIFVRRDVPYTANHSLPNTSESETVALLKKRESDE